MCCVMLRTWLTKLNSRWSVIDDGTSETVLEEKIRIQTQINKPNVTIIMICVRRILFLKSLVFIDIEQCK